MQQNSDLIELLEELNASGAKFLFVGARKVWKALVAFGAPLDRVESTYGGVKVAYISKDDLIANKRTVARPQDLADVAYLELEP